MPAAVSSWSATGRIGGGAIRGTRGWSSASALAEGRPGRLPRRPLLARFGRLSGRRRGAAARAGLCLGLSRDARAAHVLHRSQRERRTAPGTCAATAAARSDRRARLVRPDARPSDSSGGEPHSSGARGPWPGVPCRRHAHRRGAAPGTTLELTAAVHPLFFAGYAAVTRELEATLGGLGVRLRIVNETMDERNEAQRDASVDSTSRDGSRTILLQGDRGDPRPGGPRPAALPRTGLSPGAPRGRGPRGLVWISLRTLRGASDPALRGRPFGPAEA